MDRGAAGRTMYGETRIPTPKLNPGIKDTLTQKDSKRAGIEPIIGHLTKDYRLCLNFLKDIAGDQGNVLLSAAAMNFKRVMKFWKKDEN